MPAVNIFPGDMLQVGFLAPAMIWDAENAHKILRHKEDF
jgi:hypothetical protein